MDALRESTSLSVFFSNRPDQSFIVNRPFIELQTRGKQCVGPSARFIASQSSHPQMRSQLNSFFPGTCASEKTHFSLQVWNLTASAGKLCAQQAAIPCRERRAFSGS